MPQEAPVVFMQNVSHYCPTVTKTGMYRWIFVNASIFMNIRLAIPNFFHRYRQTDRRSDFIKLSFAIRTRLTSSWKDESLQLQ
jgi:hypothetical protein